MTIRLVLADDHPIVLDGLDRLFAAEEGIEVIARCRNGDEALAAVAGHRPDVLMMDLRMPARDGLGVLRALREKRLATRVVVLTAGLNELELVRAVQLGAAGLLLKETPPEELVRCVRAVAAGDTWHKLPHLHRALARAESLAGAAELTDRETEIVRLLGRGLRNKEIASRLDITEGTVKVHLHRIYEKLGVEGRLALLRWAEDRGLV